MADPKPCRFCGRPQEECLLPVDARWPERAQEAFRNRNQSFAHRCAKGQAHDMARTGWCVDRAVGHIDWNGDVPRGVHEGVVLNRLRSRRRRRI